MARCVFGGSLVTSGHSSSHLERAIRSRVSMRVRQITYDFGVDVIPKAFLLQYSTGISCVLVQAAVHCWRAHL